MQHPLPASLFHVDALSLLMIGLVAFIGLSVAGFASRYLAGDCARPRFFLLLGSLAASVMVLVSADHLLLLLAAWALSNLLLVLLMVHKPGWRAARAAGALAGRNFLTGALLVAAGFALLFVASGETSIQAIVHAPMDSAVAHAALALLLLGAMTQSAAWPFHRWLTSSLNSPTPVSAFMHAGLVNGGGYLLARFAPLYLEAPGLLTVMLVAGLVTALVGTAWKLMQHDVKRMLACSTMGQMGFMLLQCGLGLFPAAVAHLMWHGLFKASLFLGSGGAAAEKRIVPDRPPRMGTFAAALLCGALASYGFAFASHKDWLAADATLVLVAVAFIAGAQFALALLRGRALAMLPVALPASGVMGLAYGASVYLVEAVLAPAGLMRPMPLDAFHLSAIVLLFSAWLAVLFLRRPGAPGRTPGWVLRLYVKAFNASQPHPATVTAQRTHYQHL